MTKLIRKKFQGVMADNKVVDTYSTSKLDTYSCNYINKLKSYSNEEHVVGTYFGKKIYSKTFVSYDMLGAGTVLKIPHGVTNFTLMWFDMSACFLFQINSKQVQPLPNVQYYGNFADRIGMQVDNNGTDIVLYADTGWGPGWMKVITICYTKD